MKIDSFDQLAIADWAELYDAEKQIIAALPKVIVSVTDEDLAEALTNHLRETKEQIGRLEQIFDLLGEIPAGKKSRIVSDLIKEAETLMRDIKSPELLDTALAAALQKVEHYEIACYTSAIAQAKELGLGEAVELLQATLREEEAASQKLGSSAPHLAEVAEEYSIGV